MKSILQEISSIRGAKPLNIDPKNRNRYRIISCEPDGSKTAYCFSSPIYNEKTRKLLDLKFRKNGAVITTTGSNAGIVISDEISLQNADGICRIALNGKSMLAAEQRVLCGHDSISPTTNGIAYKVCLKNNPAIEIQVDAPYRKLRANDSYFAVMQQKFKPFVTVSCIGVLDKKEAVIAPAKISHQDLGNGRYRLNFCPTVASGESLLFEINLYEEKLIHDTTVESKNPKKNNAFGGTAFIGQTEAFGEQWLYVRPNFSNIIDLMDQRINHTVLHFPKHNYTDCPIQSLKTVARFCSFGSTWNKKVPSETQMPDVQYSDRFASFDITGLTTDPESKHIMVSTGMILKPRNKDGHFTVLATGDSYYAPPILEINYR